MIDRLTCEQVRDRELIERYAAGTLGDAEAESLEAHALDCQECWAAIQQAVELHAALVADVPSPARQAPRSSGRRRMWPAGLAAAAVLAMAVGTFWYLTPLDLQAPPIYRRAEAAIAVTAVREPDGSLHLTWTSADTAVLYRLRLTGTSGRELTREAVRSPFRLTAAEVTPLGDVSIQVEGENAAGEVVGRSTPVESRRPGPR